MKTTCCIALTMNPWTWTEICRALVLWHVRCLPCSPSGSASADIYKLTYTQRIRAKYMYNEFGPTPRICIDFVEVPSLLHSYQLHHENGISDFNIGQNGHRLVRAVHESCDFNLDDFGSFFLARREDEADLQDFTLEPITPSLRRLLKIQLMELERKEQVATYRCFADVKQLKHFAGLVFESMVQRQFQEEIALILVPMVRNLPVPRGDTGHWVSQPDHKSVTSSTAPNLATWVSQGSGEGGANPTNIPISIRFRPRNTVEYEGNTLRGLCPGVIYVPKASNLAGFNAFILADSGRVLYIFQFSVASSHEIEGDVMEFFSQPTPRTILELRFIFVIPPRATNQTSIIFSDSESSGARLAKLGERVKLFSAVFDFNK